MALELRIGIAVKRHFILALILAFSAAALESATLERLSLDDMIAKSTAIVRGRVGSSHAAFTGPVIYTHYAVRVVETLKGEGRGTIDVAVPGGSVNNLRQTFQGAPVLSPDAEYVFFLWTGQSGLTQVIGLTQGLFAIDSVRSGPRVADPIATRAASRELMLAPGSNVPVKDQALVMSLSQLRSRIEAALGVRRRTAK